MKKNLRNGSVSGESPGLTSSPNLVQTGLGCLALLAIAWQTTAAGASEVGGSKTFKVYQANAFVGGSIDAPLQVDPRDPNYQMKLLGTVTEVFGQILASDPPARMAGLAQEIANELPDVAGLEELYAIEMAPATAQGPGQFAVIHDYLQLLTNALAAKGAHYRVAVVATESDTAMPMLRSLQPLEFSYARIIDHEAILVRDDLPPGYLEVSNPQTGRFTDYVQIPSLGIFVYRGWCSLDVFTRGERFKVICTHPHDESALDVQAAEVAELMADLSEFETPVIILGDMNADPLGRNGTQSYQDFAAAGFKDVWAVLNPGDPAGGLTWGHDPDLASPITEAVYRIDYVLYRGERLAPLSVSILDPQINTEKAPLWPSDHAALTATFQLGNKAARAPKTKLIKH